MNITKEERQKAIEIVVWRLRAEVIKQLKVKPIEINDDLLYYKKAMEVKNERKKM